MTVCIDMHTNQPIPPCDCRSRPTQYVPNVRCAEVDDAECDKHPTCAGCPADKPADTLPEVRTSMPEVTVSPGKYLRLGEEVGDLVERKQAAYGDSFGKSGDVMRILYPAGVPAERLGDALAVVRVLDKLFRVATDRDALGESPWRDIAGYALLAIERQERNKGVH